MVRSRKDKIGKSELVYAVEALHLRPTEQLWEEAFDLHAAVHAVVYDLEVWHWLRDGPGDIYSCLLNSTSEGARPPPHRR